MDSIMEIASRYDLIVIEDACQAHGARVGGKKVGSFGAMGCFSFYPTKNLGGYGDGGMVVTNDKKNDQSLRLLRCYGERKKYQHVVKGYNSRLDEIQAALLRVKLKYLDQWNELRRGRPSSIPDAFPFGVVCPSERKESAMSITLYDQDEREGLASSVFEKKRIETLIHYPLPIPLQKAYQELGVRRRDLPLTNQWSQKILSLPFFPEIREDEMEEVAEGIRSWAERL